MPPRPDRHAIRALIFDFDGVIADTERLHYGAFREVFQARGWELGEQAYFERYLGHDDRGLVVAYAHDHALTLEAGTAEAVVQAKARAFSRHLSADVLYPSAGACVASLARHYPLAIASGALHHEIEAILKGANLLPFFPVIVGADDVERSKPSPDPYLKAAKALGVPPTACLAIEDSPGGLHSAIAAGLWTIAITTTSARRDLSPADAIIDRLDECTAAFIASLSSSPV